MTDMPSLRLEADDRGAPEHRPKRKPRRYPRSRHLFLLVFRLAGLGLLGSVALVLILRFVNPPTTAIMVEDGLDHWLRGDVQFRCQQRWVDYATIPELLPLAIMAAEDQRFPDHHGFDFIELGKVWERLEETGRAPRGASTLTQQVAKNLFLWRGRSYLRKALEAWLTLLIELTWPKRRILEVYLNVVELGPGIYGVAAASEVLLRRPLQRLSATDAALMAAALPNPRRFRIDAPTGALLDRRDWVLKQMRQLGPAWLDRI